MSKCCYIHFKPRGTKAPRFFSKGFTGGFDMKHLKFARFSGEMKDYPSWKEEWMLMVPPRVPNGRVELFKL